VGKLENIFDVKNHGLLLSAVSLSVEIMLAKPSTKPTFEKYIPN